MILFPLDKHPILGLQGYLEALVFLISRVVINFHSPQTESDCNRIHPRACSGCGGGEHLHEGGPPEAGKEDEQKQDHLLSTWDLSGRAAQLCSIAADCIFYIHIFLFGPCLFTAS